VFAVCHIPPHITGGEGLCNVRFVTMRLRLLSSEIHCAALNAAPITKRPCRPKHRLKRKVCHGPWPLAGLKRPSATGQAIGGWQYFCRLVGPSYSLDTALILGARRKERTGLAPAELSICVESKSAATSDQSGPWILFQVLVGNLKMISGFDLVGTLNSNG
jgi:hypothetical protein